VLAFTDIAAIKEDNHPSSIANRLKEIKAVSTAVGTAMVAFASMTSVRVIGNNLVASRRDSTGELADKTVVDVVAKEATVKTEVAIAGTVVAAAETTIKLLVRLD
jgi:hypothetical protein